MNIHKPEPTDPRMLPNPFRYVLGVTLLLSLVLSGCAGMDKSSGAANAFPLPAVTESATGEYHPGKFIWHDLLSPDVESSRAFYGKLFGWSFKEINDYTEIYLGQQKIGGLLPVKAKEQKPVAAHWLASVSVTDVDKAARLAADQGGRIINGPLDLGPRGTGVLISDPAGGHLLLLHTRGGDPVDESPAINGWLWNELWTAGLEPAVSFYTALLGYSHEAIQDNYVILSSDDQWRAGIHQIEDKAFAGRWVPVVRVESPEALLDSVQSLGGTVWLRPGESKTRPDAALIADDQGAMLILQRWTADNETEEVH